MNQETLESMVTHLVQCSCNGFVDYTKGIEKAPAELKDLFREITCKEVDQTASPMKWNNILKDLLSRSPQFCRDELVLPKSTTVARWRERNSREVLAPLGLEQNARNIIAGGLDMSRKRKADAIVWVPTKRVKVNDAVKPCSVLVQRESLKVLRMQYKCCRSRPFVRLYDVNHEIPQVKQVVKPVAQNEFMEFLGLASKELTSNEQRQEIKTNKPITFTSHPHIPFSSDYGRRLFARKRHDLPQEVALRKIERTEWYLKGAATSTRHIRQPEVTYNTRSKHTHTYNFPKRQYHQVHPPLQHAFIKYLCRPVCIHLEKIDLSHFLEKPKNTEPKMPETVVIEEFEKDDDVIFISETVLPVTKRKVLTSEPLSGDDGSDVRLQPQSSRLYLKCRKSFRLNDTKSLS